MELKFFSINEIKKGKNILKGSVESARRIYKDVSVDYITPKHVGFTSLDKLHDTKHSIIYFSEKEFPNSWNCDCHLHSIKKIFCKHILAVFIRLNKDQTFLKKFKKTSL